MKPEAPNLMEVRPGRVDDLFLAIAKRICQRDTHTAFLFAFVEPDLTRLARRHLSKIRIPGAPNPRLNKIGRRKGRIRRKREEEPTGL